MTRAGYIPTSKALPVMPEQVKQDVAKGIVPKVDRVALTLDDLARTEHVYTAKTSKVHYKERGY